MKVKMLLLASAVLLLASPGAKAQGNSDACHNSYGACMERCSARPQSLQESCSNSCESSTNACYTQMYGSRASGAPISSQGESGADANEARDEAKPADGSPVTKPAAKVKKKHD